MNQEIEYVARALYEAENDAHVWDRASETIKDEFRLYAKAAIDMFDRQKEMTEGANPDVPYAA